MRGGVVYFVKPIGFDGPIKIGVASEMGYRHRALTKQSPFELEILATITGDKILERRFHTKFAACRKHGEWFHTTPELLDTICAINAKTFDVGSLPAPAKKGQVTPRSLAFLTPQYRYARSVESRIGNLQRKGLPYRYAEAALGGQYGMWLRQISGYELETIRPRIEALISSWRTIYRAELTPCSAPEDGTSAPLPSSTLKDAGDDSDTHRAAAIAPQHSHVAALAGEVG